MSYNIVHSGYSFNKEAIIIIEKKIKNLKIANSGLESNKFFSDFYSNINFWNLERIKFNNRKNKLLNKKKVLNFKKLYDLYSIKKMDIRIFDEIRFYNFIELFRKYNFKSVLELGSGSSTLFYEFLMGRGKKICVFDQTQEIIEKVKTKIKDNNNVKFYHSAVDIVHKSEELFFKFKRINEVYGQSFDLIYIDAPVFNNTDLKVINVLNYVEDLLDNVDFKIMLFDKKYYNYRYLENIIDKKKFELKFDFTNYSFYIKKRSQIF